MKRVLIVTAVLGIVPVELAWAAPPSAPASAPVASATATTGVATPTPTPTTPVSTVPVETAPAPTEAAAPVLAPSEQPVQSPSAPATIQTPPSTPATTRPPTASSASVEPSPYGPVATEQTPPERREPNALAQDRPATLFDPNSDYAFGGMGGVGVMYSRLAGKNVPLVCGEGAVIIDHALTLGGGGCGVAKLLKAQDYSTSSNQYDSDDRIAFGYGGAIIKYHFLSRQLVNVSIGTMIGAGGVTSGSWTYGEDDEDKEFHNARHDAVFVLEPQVGAHLNITRWLRAGAVVGYRYVAGVDTKGLNERDISGITAGGQLQAGWF